MKTLIIIPAYNEAENIVSVVNGVVNAGYDYLVVNDGSTDNTLEICTEHKFNVLDLKENLGIGGAVQAGHLYAQRYGYDIDIQFDGDGQHDIEYVPFLVEGIESGADLVIGSRFVEKTDGFQSTFMRRLGINWLSFFIRIFARLRITDPTSGFRACGKRTIDLFCKNYPIDYPEPESIVVAAKNNLQIKETSVVMRERMGGASSIRALSSIYYMIKVTIAIFTVGITSGSKKR